MYIHTHAYIYIYTYMQRVWWITGTWDSLTLSAFHNKPVTVMVINFEPTRMAFKNVYSNSHERGSPSRNRYRVPE
jgi:hypothetical protein